MLSEGGTTYSLNLSNGQSIEAYYNESYIIEENIADTDGSILETKYKKITEAELIGEKIG